MNYFQTVRVAFRALLRNKMRSFLTTLGIIIGVAAVIAMVAIGEGAKARVESAFASMGSNLLVILPGSTSSGGSYGGFGSMPTLTWDDLDAIRTEVPTVRYAAARLRATSQVIGQDFNWTTSVTGTTDEYFAIREWKAAKGGLFTPSDVEAGNKVVVLGQTVADKLFTLANPVGRTVRIKKIPFVVIGVLEPKGQSAMGEDYDDGVYIPQSTFQAKIQGGLVKYLNGSIYVGSDSPEGTARAQAQIRGLLRDRHSLDPEDEDDFSIRNLTEMAMAMEESTSTLTTLLASIAAVSLLVGGIGIMNIMLVSVTERTREIGIRMAIGAKPRIILAQFLAESLVLSTAGGLVGIAVGIFAANALASRFGWSILVNPEIIFVSVGFSSFVGVAFGLYPARKASRLDPIEALRYE
jgi:putative ABC transport system permease protein